MEKIYVIMFHYDDFPKQLMMQFPDGNILMMRKYNIESVKSEIISRFIRHDKNLDNVVITDTDKHTFTVKFTYVDNPDVWITCEWMCVQDHVDKNKHCSIIFENEIEGFRADGKYSVPRYHTSVNQC